MILQVAITLIALGCSALAIADDIVLQVGSRFSVYAPPSCHRLEQSHFSLVLDCTFQAGHSRFYLKEYPGQADKTFNPHEFPPAKYDARAYLSAALRAVVDELSPGMLSRLKIINWGGNASDDADALFWNEGYLEDQASGPETIGICTFLRAQSYRGGLSAVLFAISDVGRSSLDDHTSSCQRVPKEVNTILGSLGDVFDGGRFIGARPKQ
jgi:hypothetical protein